MLLLRVVRLPCLPLCDLSEVPLIQPDAVVFLLAAKEWLRGTPHPDVLPGKQQGRPDGEDGRVAHRAQAQGRPPLGDERRERGKMAKKNPALKV